MQKKPLMFCGFTTMMGVLGAFLRWLQNMLGFETGSGLPITYSPWHFIFIIYLVGFALWLLLYVHKLKGTTEPKEYPVAFSCNSKLWKVGTTFFALLMALSSALILFDVVTAEERSIFNLVLGLFSIVCAICFMSFINGTRGMNVKNGSFSSIVIVIFYCYYLIATYKVYAAEPVIWHFAIQIISASACLLAFYYVAGFAYKNAKIPTTIFFCHLGAFFAIISCADNVNIGIDLISISTAGMLLLISYAQLQNIAEYRNKTVL